MKRTKQQLAENRRLAETLRNRRLASGLKQCWVAERMGIAAPQLADLETGKRFWLPKWRSKFDEVVR